MQFSPTFTLCHTNAREDTYVAQLNPWALMYCVESLANPVELLRADGHERLMARRRVRLGQRL